jgi:hypothetical protein
MTQRDVILDALRSAGGKGICVTDLGQIDWTVVLTARNRIAEARADGVPIRSEVCRVHKHRSSIARYFLVTAPVQMALI